MSLCSGTFRTLLICEFYRTEKYGLVSMLFFYGKKNGKAERRTIRDRAKLLWWDTYNFKGLFKPCSIIQPTRATIRRVTPLLEWFSQPAESIHRDWIPNKTQFYGGFAEPAALFQLLEAFGVVSSSHRRIRSSETVFFSHIYCFYLQHFTGWFIFV